jgi:hypothetical protein
MDMVIDVKIYIATTFLLLIGIHLINEVEIEG